MEVTQRKLDHLSEGFLELATRAGRAGRRVGPGGHLMLEAAGWPVPDIAGALLAIRQYLTLVEHHVGHGHGAAPEVPGANGRAPAATSTDTAVCGSRAHRVA